MPPAALVRTIGSFDVSPESWNAPITMPARVVIAMRSSIVRPVPSIASMTARQLGRVSFCRQPTRSVAATASIPALPASQSPIMRVYMSTPSGTRNTQPRRMTSRSRGSSARGSPVSPSFAASRSI